MHWRFYLENQNTCFSIVLLFQLWGFLVSFRHSPIACPSVQFKFHARYICPPWTVFIFNVFVLCVPKMICAIKNIALGMKNVPHRPALTFQKLSTRFNGETLFHIPLFHFAWCTIITQLHHRVVNLVNFFTKFHQSKDSI